ncbi:hypothetical protein ILUMI_03125 [Ignelater luminosus]|uniref:Cilia- and flagella-associated protein 251 n=1 Tax=Ignelater luminosus TaxID=2038154 RepID=A0A8K0DC62_IGNLU|nr:hypothetical protein ILUMI_03125 [Ignelater luminosus]
MKDALDFDDVSDNIADPCYLENCMCEDRSEEYEYLYTQLVPSDATLQRLPFIVRDFIVGTEDGKVAQIDYMHNQCNFFFSKADAPVTAIETHAEKPYLIIGYANGAISLYNYITRDLIIERTLEMETDKTQEDANAITYIKYSPESLHLACGRENGEIYFLDTVVLTAKTMPYQITKAKVLKLAFSLDNIYFAYYDENSTVVLMRYCTKVARWVFFGKIRSHYKPINDILFSTYLPSRFFSIGEDRYIVEYDILGSNNGNLEILNRERIEQTAIPVCFIYNPPNGNAKSEYFFVSDNQFKYKLIHDVTYMCQSVRLGPAYGCYKDSSVKKMDFIPQHDYRYLIFANDNHIGIQKFPVDGNPYKYVGIIGHPTRIADFRLCHDGKFLFTFGDNDPCVLMWSINVTSVEIMEKLGGVELEPYYCLIDGGMQGWLFKEMQDLFYYMQILHQGENTVLPRIVTDQIPVAELPDLMRACGFYPSEYEIENMIVDARYRDYAETKALNENVSFLDFVKMYINHRPAHGIHMDTLKDRFETFCLAGEGATSRSIHAESFVTTICERGEMFTASKAYTCLATLMHAIDDNEDEVNRNFTFLPEEITFENFLEEILGMDMERQPTDDENPIYLEEEDEVC